nr:Homing endonuclease [Fusarium pseudograminearum]YP_010390553.1 homing endonuclease [Fusarium acaciae-mearnsii]YP_010390719.1 homing endonuclease [Fusarium austroamericanum]YP_010390776.1 homing endonuclease [Fusarium boothii]YP_010390876.1 homing endonuclease [Fusarium cortaderiae]YP_010390930.1 homing endonuclease [Fusarium louisianense]YP_010390981.1 homing endonuclease [Fusarium meridionale]YP_010391033.1 homing endonuclease [Fusarium mesoamericanum]YP_010391144.1 homing endonuclease 
MVRRNCYLITFYTFLKTESYISSFYQNNSLLTESADSLKPARVGKVGNKEMTLYEVKSLFQTIKNSDPSYEGSEKEFGLLANGFWQAEGYIGGIFRSELNFYPICSATQLFSEESAKFFIRLDKALCNKGTFSITLNSFGKFVIAYRLSGWDTFFSVFVPYFYMQYGEKYRAILKLKKIYELKDYIKHHSSDDKAKVLLVSLVYSLTAHSPRYKVSLEEKLISLNLDQGLLKELPLYKENDVKPSFLFILGFFLGDGTLHLKLEWKDKNSTVVIVPLFNIIQSNVESNKYIMERMTSCLNALNIKANLDKGTNTFTLTVKGIDNVFNSLFPLLKKYSHFLYGKRDSFNLLVWVEGLIRSGGHHTYFGLKALVYRIYHSTNERITDKEVWMSRLEDWLKAVSARRECGEYYISPIYTSNKQIIGWQVRFPSTLKLPKSNKAFMSSTCGGQDKALAIAVQYRDKILSDWINLNF